MYQGRSVTSNELNEFAEMCSGSEEGSYLRLMTFVSLTSRLESNKEGDDEVTSNP